MKFKKNIFSMIFQKYPKFRQLWPLWLVNCDMENVQLLFLTKKYRLEIIHFLVITQITFRFPKSLRTLSPYHGRSFGHIFPGLSKKNIFHDLSFVKKNLVINRYLRVDNNLCKRINIILKIMHFPQGMCDRRIHHGRWWVKLCTPSTQDQEFMRSL